MDHSMINIHVPSNNWEMIIDHSGTLCHYLCHYLWIYIYIYMFVSTVYHLSLSSHLIDHIVGQLM